MTGKERYEHIEIPAQLTGVIAAAQKRRPPINDPNA